MSTQSTGLFGELFGGLFAIVMLAVFGLMIASMWKVFVKTGEPGWAALVPVYNLITMLKITGKLLWWLAMFCIPFANFVVIVMITINLAKSFGKSSGFGLGLRFLGVVFFPILAFGDARYQGPAGSSPLVMAPV
jgi:hypothetical protein